MKTLRKIGMLTAVLIVITACNKTEINSDRLIEGGTWKVTELSVDGVNEDELPTWEIEECDIYAESCHAEWENDEGGHTEFIWQFRDKGKTFEISHQLGEDEDEEHDHDHGHDHEHDHNSGHAELEVKAQAYAFSGVYDVVERKKDMMQFQSTAAIGHTGKSVIIKIEKQ